MGSRRQVGIPVDLSLVDKMLGISNKADEEAHERGENYEFEVRDDLGTPEAPVAVNGEHVVLLLNEEEKEGIAMSPETALRVANALLEGARTVLAEGDPTLDMGGTSEMEEAGALVVIRDAEEVVTVKRTTYVLADLPTGGIALFDLDKQQAVTLKPDVAREIGQSLIEAADLIEGPYVEAEPKE